MNKVKPPKVALFLLTLILPKSIQNNLIGDLIEEFEALSEQDGKAANAWFWQQTVDTNLIYLASLIRRPSVLQKLNILLPLSLFTLTILLISWLSNMDSLEGYSDGMWPSLLEGKIHLALFEPAFWQDSTVFFTEVTNIQMFLDIPSIVFAFVVLITLRYLNKKLRISAVNMAVWGYTLVLLPYLWALIHINTQQLSPTQIGPLLAFGLLSFLYLVLPVSYMVNKKLKRLQE